MYFYLSANLNALLTCLLLWILWRSLDFSEQDFILETVMRSYSRRQDFTTEPKAPRLIYLARWNTKTNQQRRTAPFLSFTFDPDTSQTDTVIFSEFSWKIVFTKKTSRISKPSSVFEKLGLGSKYRGEQRFSTQSGEKNATVTGDAQIKSLWQRQSPSSTQPRSQGLSSSRPSGKMRDPGNEVDLGAHKRACSGTGYGGLFRFYSPASPYVNLSTSCY